MLYSDKAVLSTSISRAHGAKLSLQTTTSSYQEMPQAKLYHQLHMALK